jgi:hypothetical protein
MLTKRPKKEALEPEPQAVPVAKTKAKKAKVEHMPELGTDNPLALAVYAPQGGQSEVQPNEQANDEGDDEQRPDVDPDIEKGLSAEAKKTLKALDKVTVKTDHLFLDQAGFIGRLHEDDSVQQKGGVYEVLYKRPESRDSWHKSKISKALNTYRFVFAAIGSPEEAKEFLIEKNVTQGEVLNALAGLARVKAEQRQPFDVREVVNQIAEQSYKDRLKTLSGSSSSSHGKEKPMSDMRPLKIQISGKDAGQFEEALDYAVRNIASHIGEEVSYTDCMGFLQCVLADIDIALLSKMYVSSRNGELGELLASTAPQQIGEPDTADEKRIQPTGMDDRLFALLCRIDDNLPQRDAKQHGYVKAEYVKVKEYMITQGWEDIGDWEMIDPMPFESEATGEDNEL